MTNTTCFVPGILTSRCTHSYPQASTKTQRHKTVVNNKRCPCWNTDSYFTVPMKYQVSQSSSTDSYSSVIHDQKNVDFCVRFHKVKRLKCIQLILKQQSPLPIMSAKFVDSLTFNFEEDLPLDTLTVQRELAAADGVLNTPISRECWLHRRQPPALFVRLAYPVVGPLRSWMLANPQTWLTLLAMDFVVSE